MLPIERSLIEVNHAGHRIVALRHPNGKLFEIGKHCLHDPGKMRTALSEWFDSWYTEISPDEHYPICVPCRGSGNVFDKEKGVRVKCEKCEGQGTLLLQ